MTVPDQPRDRGGRYQEMLLSDPGQLALDSGALDLGSSTEGTFEFPPYLGDAAKIIEFWTEVEVPEEVLVATVAAYDARLALHAKKLQAAWEQHNPKPDRPDLVQAWQQAATDWARSQLPFPERIPDLWVRALVKLAKMQESTVYLERSKPEDVRQVRSLRVSFPGGQEKTVQQWVEEFRIVELLPMMNDFNRRASAFRVARQAAEQRMVV